MQTSRVHTDTWGPAGIDVASGAGPSPHAQLVVAGKAGWIVFTNRVDFAGAKLRAGRWTGWNPTLWQRRIRRARRTHRHPRGGVLLRRRL